MTDPGLLPVRAAERLGRLFVWADQLEVTRQERAVLMHLIAVGNDHLDSFWSHGKIAEKIGYGERVVRAALASLEKKALVNRQMRKHSDGTRSSDRVRVLCPFELLRERESEAERRAELDAELETEKRMIYGPAHIAAPLNSGAAHSAEELSYTSIERDIGTEVTRQILPLGRKTRSQRSTQPRRLSVLIEDAA